MREALDRRHGEVVAGNYVLEHVLGVGGMGVVYAARQRSLERPVAVKMPLPDVAAMPHLQEQFRREALVAGRLWHRNIVSVIDYGEWKNAPYLVMERVQGVLLGRAIAQRGLFDIAGAIEVTAQLLDALEVAHAAGFVHADVKSDNVLLEETRDDATTVRLFDFGLAADAVTARRGYEVVLGTPDYMAPEVIRGGQPCIGSDIYGVGIILYELLTGVTPFSRGVKTEVLAAHLREPVTPPSRVRLDGEITPVLDELVLRALDKRPEARPHSASALASELRTAAARGFARGTSRSTVTLPAPAPLPSPSPSPAPSRSPVDDLRADVAAARKRNDVEAMADAYLALARGLLDHHEPRAAAHELETATEVLELAAVGGRPVEALWCVLVTLAAIYGHLGEPHRASEAARAAHDHAVRVGSRIGQQRAEAVYARLAAPHAHPLHVRI